MGADTWRDPSVKNGRIGGLTYKEYTQASAADQIKTYGAWLDHYKFKQKNAKVGLDLSKLSPAEQAAILQANQFSPNGMEWRKAAAQGNYNVPSSPKNPKTGRRAKQASALGSTSIGDMSNYYSGILKKSPGVYSKPNNIKGSSGKSDLIGSTGDSKGMSNNEMLKEYKRTVSSSKDYLRSQGNFSAGGSKDLMAAKGYDAIGNLNNPSSIKFARAVKAYNEYAKENGLPAAEVTSAARFGHIEGMPGGFGDRKKSNHSAGMALDVTFGKGLTHANTSKEMTVFSKFAKKEGLYWGKEVYGTTREGHHWQSHPNKVNPFKSMFKDKKLTPAEVSRMMDADPSNPYGKTITEQIRAYKAGGMSQDAATNLVSDQLREAGAKGSRNDLNNEINDISKKAGFGNKFGRFEKGGIKGLTVHHTAGRGDANQVVKVFKQRGYPAQYILDREGNLHRALPEGAKGQHMKNSWGKTAGKGFGNRNMEGIEVIAKNDRDWTPAQREKMKEFAVWHSEKYGYDPMKTTFSHGEVNPGHRDWGKGKKQSEGWAFLHDFRANYAEYKKQYGAGGTGSTQLAKIDPKSGIGGIAASAKGLGEAKSSPPPVSQRGLTQYAGLPDKAGISKVKPSDKAGIPKESRISGLAAAAAKSQAASGTGATIKGSNAASTLTGSTQGPAVAAAGAKTVKSSTMPSLPEQNPISTDKAGAKPKSVPAPVAAKKPAATPTKPAGGTLGITDKKRLDANAAAKKSAEASAVSSRLGVSKKRLDANKLKRDEVSSSRLGLPASKLAKNPGLPKKDQKDGSMGSEENTTGGGSNNPGESGERYSGGKEMPTPTGYNPESEEASPGNNGYGTYMNCFI